ncbi:MAG: hypothetical protein H0X62_02590 [Bacteroidetes bacterium]|nr:hypothetical protein [Bacteroidota bacterium]
MKKLILSVVFVAFSAISGFSQDVIIKNDGDEIKALVKEITTTEVKYKRYDNPDGPLIYISKKDVFMIKYENGTVEKIGAGSKQAREPVVPAKVHPAQPSGETPIIKPINLSGPRLGILLVGPGRSRNNLRDNFDAEPVLSLFGWQFETRFFTLDDGTTGVFEFVPLIAGLEQGLFLPTASAIVGIRSAKGLEVGMGPNLSLAGAGMVFAAGVTFQSSQINFPVNFAVVTSPAGLRYSLLVGFNIRRS